MPLWERVVPRRLFVVITSGMHCGADGINYIVQDVKDTGEGLGV